MRGQMSSKLILERIKGAWGFTRMTKGPKLKPEKKFRNGKNSWELRLSKTSTKRNRRVMTHCESTPI